MGVLWSELQVPVGLCSAGTLGRGLATGGAWEMRRPNRGFHGISPAWASEGWEGPESTGHELGGQSHGLCLSPGDTEAMRQGSTGRAPWTPAGSRLML